MSRITINTNTISLNTQRRFGQHTNALRSSFDKLSSGLRITKAADDSAGLSISSLLDADKKVANQGVRNINDGISYLNVAEGAINELSNIIIRVQELAEQSANGTLGTAQRSALQSEVTALQSEYNRIIDTTRFNGNQLLTGLNTKTILQGGYGVAGQLATQIGDAALGIIDDPTRAGSTVRASTGTGGTQATGGTSQDSVISANGRYIAFYSVATDLVTGDTNGQRDVFRKDLITGETVRVSVSSDGSQAIGGDSDRPSISGDGRYVVFQSTATNLVLGDTNGNSDLFRKDLVTGEIVRVNTKSDGTQVSSSISDRPSVSADGRYVAFHSNSSELVANDTNGQYDIFRKDLLTGEVLRVSVSANGTQATSVSRTPNISADGRYVAFESSSSNLVAGDTNGRSDIFRKDLLTGEVLRATTDSNGIETNGNSEYGRISGDGRYIVFNSAGTNLVTGDSNGNDDVFRKDLLTGELLLVSSASDGTLATGGNSVRSSISADGRYVAYESLATNLVNDDTNGVTDTFRKDMITGETIRLNIRDDGIQPAGGFSTDVSISADGRKVVFQSSKANLITNDTNGQYDIFVRKGDSAGVQQLSGMLVTNQGSARVTLDIAKQYQEELSSYKAGLGASISRATTFVNTLLIQSENYAAASSQITDLDVAEESSNLLKTQILQQASSSILAQANQQPELALVLLRGI